MTFTLTTDSKGYDYLGALSQGVLGSDPDSFERHIKPMPSQLQRGIAWVSFWGQANLAGWGPLAIEFPVLTPIVTTFTTSTLTPFATPVVSTFVTHIVTLDLTTDSKEYDY